MPSPRISLKDRLKTRALKTLGTLLVAPQALPLPQRVRIRHLRLLKKTLYHDLTQDLPSWFREYLTLVVVAQNQRYGIGKQTLDDYLTVARFDEEPTDTCSDGANIKQMSEFVYTNFPYPYPDKRTALVQFTGGKDSTLATLVASTYHEGNIELLNFDNGLIINAERVPLNVQLLRHEFGDRYNLVTEDVSNLIRRVHLSRYFADLKKYGLEMAGFFCGSCRVSMHIKTIEYCLKNGIDVVYDGSNTTGFDISQRPWFNNIMALFYAEFEIEYRTPAMNVERSDLLLTNLLGPNVRGSQGECQGGGETHNTLWRCYSLDKYGKEEHEMILEQWTIERLNIAREYLLEIGLQGKK